MKVQPPLLTPDDAEGARDHLKCARPRTFPGLRSRFVITSEHYASLARVPLVKAPEREADEPAEGGEDGGHSSTRTSRSMYSRPSFFQMGISPSIAHLCRVAPSASYVRRTMHRPRLNRVGKSFQFCPRA